MKDLGTFHYFLGVEALFDWQGLFLSQRQYITETLSQFTGDSFSDEMLYRSVFGFLQYLAITWLDIAFVVGQVCEFMHRPTTLHLSAVKRILR